MTTGKQQKTDAESELDPRTGPKDAPASSQRSLRLLPQTTSWVPTWTTRLVFLLGLLNILSGSLPRHRRVFDWSLDILPPLGIISVSVISIGVGFGLLIMARGLRRRKQRAWRAVVALLATSTAVHLIRGTDHVQTIITIMVLLVLVLSRDQFIGRPDPATRRSLPLIFGAMLVSTWLIGCFSIVREHRELVPGWHASSVLEHAFLGMIGITGPLRFSSRHAATETAVFLAGLGIITLVVTIAVFLKTPRHTDIGTDADRDRVRALLVDHGAVDSLSYFATRDDKSVVFSVSGKAAVSYRVISGVSLASGDPIGDVEAWPGAIEAWLAQARIHAWIPAVLSASETGAEVYQRIGFDALELGDEALIEVADFTLEGRSMRSVRQAVNRVARSGYHTIIQRTAAFSADRLRAVDLESSSWRGHGGPERGFSMALSRFGDPRDPDCVIVLGRNQAGELKVVLQFVPWGTDGLSLDLMRRHPDLDNGVMEFVIANLLKACPSLGIQRISLNFAVFRSSLARGERIGAGPITRAWVGFLLFLSRWWQIASLYRANAKFRPSWEPRFICFTQARDLGHITWAALQAEGYLRLPWHRKIKEPRRNDSLQNAQLGQHTVVSADPRTSSSGRRRSC